MDDEQNTKTTAEELPRKFTTQSPEINELAGALSLAQGEMNPAKKGAANTFFKSKYADLSEVIEASRYPLSSNDLAIVQYADDGYVVTQLMHSSGQWIRGRLRIQPKDNTPQGIGSALTYARRYSWQMMVGIGAEDDDGEAAMGRMGSAYDPEHAKPPKRKAPAKKQPATPRKKTPARVEEEPKEEEKPTSEEKPKPPEKKPKKEKPKKEEPKLTFSEEVKVIVDKVDKARPYLVFHDVDPDKIPASVAERIAAKGIDGFGELVAQWILTQEEEGEEQ